MAKLNCLFIGFEYLPESKKDEKFRLSKISRLPTAKRLPIVGMGNVKQRKYKFEDISIFNYQIVFLNHLHDFSPGEYNQGFKSYLVNLKKDLSNFIIQGGILCVFLSPRNSFFIDEYIDIKHRSGEDVIPAQNHWLKVILQNKDFKFQWSGIIFLENMKNFRQNFDHYPIANMGMLYPSGHTPINQIVACTIDYVNQGHIIILPSPVEMSTDLLRELLDLIKLRYFPEFIPKDTYEQPKWLENYFIDEEKKLALKYYELIIESENILSNIKKYSNYKKILYWSGHELTTFVGNVFNKIGFEVENKESEGKHDLEINKGNFEGLIEVKGLKGQAKVGDLRQLLDHYLRQKEDRPNLKGIFIVNHYREIDPENRDIAYTPTAEEIGKNNKFCLLTTYDLYQMYINKIDINNIVDLFSRTNGILKLD